MMNLHSTDRYSAWWRVLPFIFLWLLGSLSPAHAGDAFTDEIKEMRTIYLAAVESGDKRELRRAIKHINGLARKYPDHPLVVVYQGCILAERGRDAGERPVNRKRNTEEGLQLVDRGLLLLQQRETPLYDNAEARLLAAFLFIHLPDTLFHRFGQGSQLVEGLLADPRFDEMPVPLQAAIYFAAAIVADKKGDREEQRRYLELTLTTAPEGYNAKKARTMLDALMVQ